MAANSWRYYALISLGIQFILLCVSYHRLPYSQYFLGSDAWALEQVQKQFTISLQEHDHQRVVISNWKTYSSDVNHAKLSIGVITVKRKSKNYFWTSVVALLEDWYNFYLKHKKIEMHVLICNCNSDPEKEKINENLAPSVTTFDVYAQPRLKPPPMNVKEKETYDYVACLSKLADSSSGSQYIILMEDDMWIKPTFLEHIERLLNFYSAYPDPKWAFTKLFYPDQHKGFELTFWSVLELVTSSVIIGAISAVLWRAVTGTRRRHLPFSKLTPLHIFNVLLILVMLNRQHTLIPLYHVVHPFKHDIPHGSSSGAILWSKKHANNMYDYAMAMPNMNKEIDFILNDFVRDNNLSAYSLEYNVFDHIGYESSISNNKRGAKHFLRY